jgi:hypothetical protein
VYQINADSLMAVMSPFVVAHYQGHFFKSWNQLGQAPGDLMLTRIAQNTVRLESEQGVVESYLWLFRRPDIPWKVDAPIQKNRLQVIVRKTEDDMPTVVDCHIDGLSRGNACFVRADGFLLTNQPIPKVSEQVKVSWVTPVP